MSSSRNKGAAQAYLQVFQQRVAGRLAFFFAPVWQQRVERPEELPVRDAFGAV